jgi:hypothetical protein
MGRFELALEEYKQLRAEIIAHSQAQTTVVSVALAATAALAGVAFGTGEDSARLEILLAVPLVLIGLGLTYLAHSVHNVAIGQYIAQRLWPALAAARPDDAASATVIHSWERTVAEGRRLSNAAKGVRGWLSVVPGLFLFGFPSGAALAINYELAWFPIGTDTAASGLRIAWLLESVALALAAFMIFAAGQLSSKQRP